MFMLGKYSPIMVEVAQEITLNKLHHELQLLFVTSSMHIGHKSRVDVHRGFV